MRNKPAYAVDAVDHALQLATLLRQEGRLRVTDAAAALGVSRSTAHRLLVTLVYRDFAVQDRDRSYLPGPLLVPASPADPAVLPGAPSVVRLRQVARPHLNQVVAETGESCNVQVLAGQQAHVVAYVEGPGWLRVGDRFTREWDAWLTSGGRILLSQLGDDELAERLPSWPAARVERLQRELEVCRRRGYAVNDQHTEDGVTALAVLVRAPQGMPLAAIALALPTPRFDRDLVPAWVGALSAASAQITRDLGGAHAAYDALGASPRG